MCSGCGRLALRKLLGDYGFIFLLGVIRVAGINEFDGLPQMLIHGLSRIDLVS
jgi:hypothetical protein